ncbi:thiamine pyrophosphate-dependent enzyme [Lachnoclostridium pacaense]|uniref:thiamine pyrophosphate-dependent enzyme n=1 Tax=Enterocloster hominis (ex Hitch et al. 2024) TaxID=1917870 RepID=UPI001D0F55B4|nr:thiamine pyrophosphate-dependent enzyme [Lachnoclostridium pacaense]MCC2879296.1 thiamine pyrophosphate-dependent enzyme [Lachnoclostridium pacaense]
MSKSFLMGNEAIGLGAVRAGVQVVSGYPGTPSTEVLETVAKHNPGDIYVEWSVNEKAAMEVAAAAAYTGARTMVTMKQVGLNVASDPLMSLAYVGVKGGMVVMVADDPGPISSQTEQDTRHFGQFSKLPVFDPSSPEEAYEMIGDAFDYSEKYHTPVLFRPTTRICHGCASVELKERICLPAPQGFVKDSNKWVIFPRLSNANHRMIEARNPVIGDDFSSYRFNLLHREEKETVQGIITHGISYEFVMEALNGYKGARVIKISTPNPTPEKLMLQFMDGLNEVMAVEELDPVLEQELMLLCGKHHLNVDIRGKLTGDVQCAGENSVESVRKVLEAYLGAPYIEYMESLDEASDGASDEAVDEASDEAADAAAGASSDMASDEAAGASSDMAAGAASLPVPPLPIRPPVLCAGCPHRASFYAVKRAMEKLNQELPDGQEPMEGIYCGDIGCYTLGNAKPLDMVDTCLCMGAGITMAQGMQRVEPHKRYFSFVGDSTFFASGLTGIVNAVYNEANLTLCILDNSTTAMTGHQPHPGTGHTMMGQVVEKVDITKVLEGIGIKHIRTVDALDLKQCVDTVLEFSALNGVKAVIFKAPCIAIVKTTKKCRIVEDRCVDCRTCINEIGCPALVLDQDKVKIDSGLCTGCGLCGQICTVDAIEPVE